MKDPRFSVGIYICDGCETPINVARLVLLQPNSEKASQFKDPSKLRGVIVAFCKHCNAKEEIVARTLKAVVAHYNKWVPKQLR